MTNTTPVTFPGVLIAVGVRPWGSVEIEVNPCVACDLAPSLNTKVEVVAAGTVQRLSYFAEVLNASCAQERQAREAAERELLRANEGAATHRHAVEVIVEMLKGGDINEALAHAMEVLRG